MSGQTMVQKRPNDPSSHSITCTAMTAKDGYGE
jgi:hypothetical protein